MADKQHDRNVNDINKIKRQLTMDGPRDYHTKWSKSERKRQISYDITYMWDLKKWYKWIYLQNRNKLTDFENKLMATKGEKGWERDKLKVCD